MKQYPWIGYKGEPLTELRVHGAGDTPIEELLDSDTYVRVAGDDTAGFYRVPESDRPKDLDESDPRYATFNLGHASNPKVEGDVEAYYWGRFSTGGGWRAFWILLLPFALVNLAGWNSPRTSGFTRALVRLFGLLTSIALVYWVTSITIGVLAECGPDSLCAERKWYLGFVDIGLLAGKPSRIMLIALLIGVLLTLALWWWPGRRSADGYERYTPREEPENPDQAASKTLLSADGPALWYSEWATKELASAHVLAMLAALAAGAFVTVGDVLEQERITSDASYSITFPAQAPAIVGIVVCLAVIVLAAVYVATLDPLKQTVEAQTIKDKPADTGWLSVTIGLILVAAGGLWIWITPLSGETGAATVRRVALQLVYLRYADDGLVAISVLVLVVLALLIIARAWAWFRSKDRKRNVMAGFGPPIVASAAIVILAAMVSGTILWVADLFGEPDYQIPAIEKVIDLRDKAEQGLVNIINIDLSDGLQPDEKVVLRTALDDIGRFRDLEADLGEPLIRLGTEYYLMPLVFMLLVAIMAVFVALVAWASRRRIPDKGMLKKHRIDNPIVNAVDEVRPNDEPSRAKLETEIAKLLRKPYKNRRFHWLLLFPFTTVLIAIPTMLWKLSDIQERAEAINILLRPAVWLTVGFFFLLAFVVRDNYRGGATRGALGGIWDIVTYWPRFYHPFAPPSYAVRAVPELAERVTQLTSEDEQRLVLSAHSQGVPTTLSVLGLITDPRLRNRIALITYGSPTGMLYARFFPDYFDSVQLAVMSGSIETEEVVRWTNLYRLTDWTGGFAQGPARDRYFPLLPLFEQGDAATDAQNPEDQTPLYVKAAGDLTDKLTEYRLSDPDPVTMCEVGRTDPLVPPTGHGDYLHDRLYSQFRQKLVDSLYTGWVRGKPPAAPSEEPPPLDRMDVARGLGLMSKHVQVDGDASGKQTK